MKRLAIVSSFSESCGNAAFTRVLQDSIERHSDVSVEVVELNLQLLQSSARAVRRKADKHIDELCLQLAEFDAVNLQLEAGLYGTVPNDIVSRVTKLMKANPVMSVTLHSPRLKSATNYGIREGIKNLMRFKLITGFTQILDELRGNVHVNINRKMIKAAEGMGHRLIVHTKRASDQIRIFFDYENTSIHPLKIVPETFQPDHTVLNQIKHELGVVKNDILIGVFGYISAYKGHTDALDALKNLPPEYKLLIFGRQHPQTIKANGKVDDYLGLLKEQILMDKERVRKVDLAQSRVANKPLKPTLSLHDRVFFLGELDDEDFLNVAGSVDVAWLPYYENGQDGSGIASICLDASPKVVCSSSFAFDQLFRLVKYKNTARFDIGNSLELANRTIQIMRRPEVERPYAESDVYSLETQVETYIAELKE